jgi:type II secretory pathway component PulF
MTTTPFAPQPEPRWATYLKAGVFIFPAIAIWAFGCVFLFPKVKQICADAGAMDNAFAIRLMSISDLVLNYWFMGSLGVLGVLIGLEWLPGFWPRYRRNAVGTGVFLVNTAVLVLMAAMLTLAMLAAPGLRAAR